MGNFDDSVEQAWSDFQARLADVIATMHDDDLLALELGEESTVEGFVPCVQFLAWGGDQVRCEVPSNSYLDPRHRLTESDEARLVELGWHRPTRQPDSEPDAGSPAFYVDKPANWADQLAAMAVTVFRETWSVPHPSFLHTEALGTIEGQGFDATPPAADDADALDIKEAVVPRDEEHLRDLVRRTLSHIFDDPYDLERDGDFMLVTSKAIGTVSPWFEGEEVQLWVPLVQHLSDRTRASELVADLNREWPRLKFTLAGDRVAVRTAVPANPYVPQHLIDTLGDLYAFVRTLDDDFAQRFGGTLNYPRPGVGSAADEPAPGEGDDPSGPAAKPPSNPARQMGLFADPNAEQTLFDEPN